METIDVVSTNKFAKKRNIPCIVMWAPGIDKRKLRNWTETRRQVKVSACQVTWPSTAFLTYTLHTVVGLLRSVRPTNCYHQSPRHAM